MTIEGLSTPNKHTTRLGDTSVRLNEGCNATITNAVEKANGFKERQVLCKEPCFVGRIFAARDNDSSDLTIQNMLDNLCQAGDNTNRSKKSERLSKISAGLRRRRQRLLMDIRAGIHFITPLDH